MNRKNLFAPIILLLAASVGLSNNAAAQDRSKQRLDVICTVVAYDDFINIAGAPQRKFLIVRVDEIIEGKEKSRYIKVLFTAIHGQKGLPDEMSSSKNKWIFSLAKAKGTECRLSVNAWIRAESSEEESLPDFDKLPCYLLEQDGFKPFNG